jgi:hypothetical protein
MTSGIIALKDRDLNGRFFEKNIREEGRARLAAAIRCGRNAQVIGTAGRKGTDEGGMNRLF